MTTGGGGITGGGVLVEAVDHRPQEACEAADRRRTAPPNTGGGGVLGCGCEAPPVGWQPPQMKGITYD